MVILFSSGPQAEKGTTFSATRRAVEMIHFVHEEKLFYSRRMSSRFPDQQPNRKKTTVVTRGRKQTIPLKELPSVSLLITHSGRIHEIHDRHP